MTNIGKRARRIHSVPGTINPTAMQGYEFDIADEYYGSYIDVNGVSHRKDSCQLLPDRIWTLVKREPIKPGTYGPVRVRDIFGDSINISIINNAYLTADELNEAAHLFNQLAEQLRDSKTEHNSSLAAAGGKLDADTPIMGNVAKMQDRADAAYKQAVSLLHAINKRHWPEGRPIAPQITLAGVLDQIDHLTSVLVVRPATQVMTNDPQRSHPFEPSSTWSKASCRICGEKQDHPHHAAFVVKEADDTPMSRAEIRKLINDTVAVALKMDHPIK